jgi:putative membrane protein
MKIATLLLIGALSTSMAAFGADTISAKEFVKKAGEAGAAEVQLGKLASQKATDAAVKKFAQQMMMDHTKANKELMTVAKSKGLEVPTEPGLMHKGVMEKLQHQSADSDFNKDYMQRMVKDHENVVQLFQTAANDTTLDPELRSFAKKTLPTLQEHLADAQKIEAKLGSM